MEITMKRSLAFMVCILAGSAVAFAQAEKTAAAPEPKTIEMPAQGWTVSCGSTAEGLVCRASQAIVVAQTRQLLTGVSVFKPMDSQALVMNLNIPHGLFLPAGMSVQVDTEPLQALAIETCDAQGCYGSMPLPEKTLAAMRKGKQLTVTFQNLSKTNVKVQLPLSGFPEALKKI
jgi:invasion protein IalB